ncbi:hypothetical protein GJ496_000494 [Pomphorhynchus laevis]|nr:hypothetical protein GJ496_000494 [Pomphorhynchus laevis]
MVESAPICWFNDQECANLLKDSLSTKFFMHSLASEEFLKSYLFPVSAMRYPAPSCLEMRLFSRMRGYSREILLYRFDSSLK